MNTDPRILMAQSQQAQLMAGIQRADFAARILCVLIPCSPKSFHSDHPDHEPASSALADLAVALADRLMHSLSRRPR